MKRNKLLEELSTGGVSRRQFLRQLSMVVGGLATAPGLVQAAQALVMGKNGRALVDELTSPSNGLVLGDVGDGYYHIYTNGLPDHATGEFPNPNCPSPILAQTGSYKITKTPKVASKATALDGWLFGIAVNGVVLDPTGPFYLGRENTGYQFEVLTKTAMPHLGIDRNMAHTQPSGEYHYHGMPAPLYQRLEQLREARGDRHGMTLLGWAADGFPIYAPFAPSRAQDPGSPLVMMKSSYTLGSGPRGPGSPGGKREDAGGVFVQDFVFRQGLGDLDECNGRFGATPEFPDGTYHYFLTYDFPFIPRFWRGTPDSSFFHPKPGVDAVPPALMTMKFG